MDKKLGLAIKIKTISGFQIITGIGQLSREPQATGRHNFEPIQNLSAWTELSDTAIKQAGHIRNHQKAVKNEEIQLGIVAGKEKELAERQAEYLTLKPNSPETKDCEALIADHQHKIKFHKKKADKYKTDQTNEDGAAKAANTDLIEIHGRFEKDKKSHLRENPIFCEAGLGELVDSDILMCVPDAEGLPVVMTAVSHNPDICVPNNMTVAVLIEMFKEKPEHTQIKTDGSEVDDFRGCQYFYNDGSQWIEEPEITNLNVTMETTVADEFEDVAIEKKDLSADQREEIRFQNLSEEDKTAEYDQKKAALLNESINLRMGWEIEGVTKTKALTDSQTFYNNGLAVLNIKYGVA